MADMTEIREEIRKRLGGPSTDAVSDESIETAIVSALEELSRILPVIVYEQINVQAGVSEYAIDEDIVDVIDLYASESYAMLPFFDNLGLNTFHSPSLLNIVEQKLEQWRYRYGRDWEWNMDTGKIMIIPEPIRSGIAICKCAKARTIDQIPAKILKPFKDLCYGETFETLANIYGSSGVTSVPIGIGNVTYDTSGLQSQSASIKAKALSKLSAYGGAGSVVVG